MNIHLLPTDRQDVMVAMLGLWYVGFTGLYAWLSPWRPRRRHRSP